VVRCFTVVLLMLVSVLSEAAAVEVKGLFAGSALLVVDGQQKLLKQGRSFNGVTLVSATSKEAVVEFDGQRHRLGVSKRISTRYRAVEHQQVHLAPGRGGHYVTPARINNRPVTVMVDTGATSVAMSLPQAKALGLDYRNGVKIRLSTANGMTTGYQVTLSSVTVGAVTVNNVEAVVNMGDFPRVMLLGNSYLARVNMSVEQGVLVLQSKF